MLSNKRQQASAIWLLDSILKYFESNS